MEPKTQNAIKFKDFKVVALEFEIGKIEEDDYPNLEVLVGFNIDYVDENHYAIVFNIKIENDEIGFLILISAVCHFETKDAITEEFKESKFVTLNSPAIAFPFLRTFISNFTLNAGLKPIILPSYNFTKINQEK